MGLYANDEDFIKIVKERHPYWKIIGDIPKAELDLGKINCSKCNQTFPRTRKQMLSKYTCPVCSNHIIISGFNDVATLNPWILDWVAKKDIEGEPTNSFKEITPICPKCHFSRTVTIKNFVKAINKCPNCADGISYPNKYGRSFLKQLPIKNLQTEYNPT